MQRTEARIRRLNEIYCDPLAPNMCINQASSLDVKNSSKVKEHACTEKRFEKKEEEKKKKIDQKSNLKSSCSNHLANQ